MIRTSEAQANPEKRLFISLLTRDITLEDAFLDLIDNSINAAIQSRGLKLRSAEDYWRLQNEPSSSDVAIIRLGLSPDAISIEDTSGGISFETAEQHVFVFGRSEPEAGDADTLSVYGIGLKRAIFKMGQQISILSNHTKGGFRLHLNVPEWQSKSAQPWTIPIEEYSDSDSPLGTKIQIANLNQDVAARIADKLFILQLHKRISRTYIFFLRKIVRIFVDGSEVEPSEIAIGDNVASEQFSQDDVDCLVVAGLATPKEHRYLADNSGWFIFCNGRAVVYADKTSLTGWGRLLPSFQPKHRPFLGYVFFVANNPELLPWSTTKTGINQESIVWQTALRQMAAIGRQVTGFLDKRYTDSGTDISPTELFQASGKPVPLTAPVAQGRRSFSAPTKVENSQTYVQYRVPIKDIQEIKSYLGRKNMSNSDVGRHTFDYFLKNEVEE